MQATLKRLYMIILVPAVGLFLILGLVKKLDFIQSGLCTVPSGLQSMALVLSAITAIAGPILIRSFFAHSLRRQRRVSAMKFLSFQRKILWLSLITPYLAFAAVLFEFPKFYAAAIVLMALYSVYYYFPSQKRINFDRKIFRVK